MYHKLFIIILLTLRLSSFAQIDSLLANKITISGFCLCKTTLAEIKAIDNELKEVTVEEMGPCNDGFVEDSRFENRKGYYSPKYPGIIFQKDREGYISKIRLTKDFAGKLPDGNEVNMKVLLAKDVLKLYPKRNTWGSRGCSDYWSLSNDTLYFFVKIDKTKQPQYPVDEAYYAEKPVEAIDLVVSCYSIYNKNNSFSLFSADEPMYFVDSIRTNKAFIEEAYQPTDIALVSVYKDAGAIKLAGPQAKNGVIYIITKSFARNHYWSFFKEKSADYLKKIPNLETEATVAYIVNGKPLVENYESDLFSINDSNFIELTLISKKQLKADYHIADKMFGVIIKIRQNK
ncbi:MAG: hypothetical protein HYX40_03460 [Sphingobacteriales bacterium]|nr:hypothetical protein [Sphingobacteriales bacterium]